MSRMDSVLNLSLEDTLVGAKIKLKGSNARRPQNPYHLLKSQNSSIPGSKLAGLLSM